VHLRSDWSLLPVILAYNFTFPELKSNIHFFGVFTSTSSVEIGFFHLVSLFMHTLLQCLALLFRLTLNIFSATKLGGARKFVNTILEQKHLI